MKKIALVVVLVGSAFSMLAQAGVGQRGEKTRQGLTFDEVKAACQDPSRFHNQIAPEQLQISCHDVQYKWVPANAGEIVLENKRFVTSSLVSNKYTVSTETNPVDLANQVESCPKFEEVSETVSYTRGTDCAEVTNFAGSATDFCVMLIDDQRAANAAAVIDLAKTGAMVELCSKDESRSQRGQRGQR